MTGALLRVSVVADSRRLDVAVPPGLPVAELVPGLARRLGLVSYDGLRLCTVEGRILDDRGGLAPQDVPDCSVLVLAPPPPPPPVEDDPAAVLAADPPAGGPPAPPPRAGRRWAATAAAVLVLLLAAASWGAAHDARSAAAGALLLLAGAVAVGGERPGAAAVAGAAASGFAALAAGLAAGAMRPERGVAWAAAGGAALAFGALAMAALPVHRMRVLPVLVIGAVGSVVGAALSARAVPLEAVAGCLLVVVALSTAALPWAAVARIGSPRGRVDPGALAQEVARARELLLGLGAGLGIVQCAATMVVARHGPWGMSLAACAASVVLLRARHHSSPAERLPGVVTGALGLLTVAGVALTMHEPWRVPGGWALAVLGGLLLVVQVRGSTVTGRDAALLWPALLGPVETACLAALLPLLVRAIDVPGLLP